MIARTGHGSSLNLSKNGSRRGEGKGNLSKTGKFACFCLTAAEEVSENPKNDRVF
jgi:hypothetical protein